MEELDLSRRSETSSTYTVTDLDSTRGDLLTNQSSSNKAAIIGSKKKSKKQVEDVLGF